MSSPVEHQPTDFRGLTPEEWVLFKKASGLFLFHAHFVQPLKRALVQQFGRTFPHLALKLDRMANHEFHVLCEQVQPRARKKACAETSPSQDVFQGALASGACQRPGG